MGHCAPCTGTGQDGEVVGKARRTLLRQCERDLNCCPGLWIQVFQYMVCLDHRQAQACKYACRCPHVYALLPSVMWRKR
eukprot:1153006-Pelagomonas_calceolata.AAC.3